ncbi:hypothetical protein TNCV_1254151 [Trichonephila clavipes]|nr:hypothetical protein TNCV_1254151 [Trichonephila clavipes]
MLAITQNENQYLTPMVRSNCSMNVPLLLRHIHRAAGTRISNPTAQNQLHYMGLHALRLKLSVSLTDNYHAAGRGAE